MLALKTVRLQLRFLLPLLATLVAAAFLAAPLMERLTLHWFKSELGSRGELTTRALTAPLSAALAAGDTALLRRILDQTASGQRVRALALCSAAGAILASSASYPLGLDCTSASQLAVDHGADSAPVGAAGAVPGGAPGPLTAEAQARVQALIPPGVQVGWYPMPPLAGQLPASGEHLVMLHDLSALAAHHQDSRRYLFGLIAGLGIAIALVTMVVAQLSWRSWVKGTRGLLGTDGQPDTLAAPELAPVAADLRSRIRALEDEYRRSQGPETAWTAERLRNMLGRELSGDQVIVVSNREPYIHERTDDGVTVKRPASGLVTAVEPVMRACSGTWVAHGSGSADRQVVDEHDRIGVPPGENAYHLRRVWMTEEEEQGYYYGFANEGMWPLCHVAHVRPVFRESDWEAYKAINQRFADAVVEEAHGEDPIVLVQDYHFALLPAMVRVKLPRATILTFWHIPWPNSESFGICPWRREILQGMLGSTILGFHTRYHCQNFIETVDRYLEARIAREHATIQYQGEETLVESYPISIEWPPAKEVAGWAPVPACRQAVFDRLGLRPQTKLAVGIDRFDYTKGILERINAVERLLEKYREWVGYFTFVQVAAPTRSGLEEYKGFQERIERVVARINQRFGRPNWQPIVLLAQQHGHDQVMELLRAADVCVVTSLHDGMNLVCKEFVAARDDEQGVLVLSRFAGAARELNEALIVNPYHVEETADAMYRAINMPVAEQRERMISLRSTVREFNVFRWAGRMLSDAGRYRLRSRIEARLKRFEATTDGSQPWQGETPQ